MIARDVEHALHALRVREGRRIEKDQVEPAGALGSLPEPPAAVGLHELVRGAREAVEDQIALRPVEVGSRQVDRRGRGGAPRRGVHGGGAGVGEEIEKALPVGGFAEPRAGHAVIEKQAGVEIILEVHVKLEPTLAHDAKASLAVELSVLLAAARAAPRPQA